MCYKGSLEGRSVAFRTKAACVCVGRESVRLRGGEPTRGGLLTH